MTGENYNEKIRFADEALAVNENFDVIRKEMMLCGLRAVYYYLNAFGNGELTERICGFLLRSNSIKESAEAGVDVFMAKEIPFAECSAENDYDKAIYYVMSGTAALIVEGVRSIIIIDTRSYPARSVEEPANDRVLRGPREGFVEALVPNTGLIRRRIRDMSLRIKKITIGESSKTDLAICYIDGKTDKKLLDSVVSLLRSIHLDSVNMGLESIAEAISGKNNLNPFPRMRYTERPDAACSMIMEGSIIILCDNYPSAMIVPTTFFSFTQDTNDFYFSPVIGQYLKAVRLIVYAVSLILTPVWYLLVQTPDVLPEWLLFIVPKEPGEIPLLAQLIGIEIAIDGLKLASLNTPDAMSNSLGIIGGLLLGDFAVRTGWLSPEVIFYMSFIAIANFTQPNFEMAYALKFMRLIILILTGLLGIYGFIAGILITLVLICMTPHIKGAPSYLYPLIPFNGKALIHLLFRVSLKNKK